MSKHKVEIVECERGWGPKTDEYKYFNTEKEARDFIASYNKVNEGGSSDYFMMAIYQGEE